MERTQGADGSPFSPSSVSILCQHHELPDGTMCFRETAVDNDMRSELAVVHAVASLFDHNHLLSTFFSPSLAPYGRPGAVSFSESRPLRTSRMAVNHVLRSWSRTCVSSPALTSRGSSQ
jgi:hypothetical protein